jgi:hypothetical protein
MATNVTQVAGNRIPIANPKINFVEHLTSQLLTAKQKFHNLLKVPSFYYLNNP